MVATAKTRTDRHRRSLKTSTMLIRWFYEMYRPGSVIVDAQKVVRVLSKAGVCPLLIGTHGVGGWRSQARATQDIDILIALKDHARAVRIIGIAFPEMVVESRVSATRFKDPQTGEQRIELIKPLGKTFHMAYRYCHWVGKSHRVPDLEMALILKFSGRVAPQRRRAKRMQDTADFADVVEHNQADLDLPKLGRLADQVYERGRAEIMNLVDDILTGRPIVI
jgi:hypothetical protein